MGSFFVFKTVYIIENKRKGGIHMRKTNMSRLKRYFRRTLKNKLWAMSLIGIGVISLIFSKDNDGTILVLTIILGLPIFFSNENMC